jgi:putative flippase GtrA
LTLKTLIYRYAAFAVIAITANLATQRLILQFGDSGVHFAKALGAATIVGLLIKYTLDKRWIFYDLETDVRNHKQKFFLYAAMGLVTTVTFWGSETVFWLVWQTSMMCEIGAIVGLSIGYAVKYNLDRRFVFVDQQLMVSI